MTRCELGGCLGVWPYVYPTTRHVMQMHGNLIHSFHVAAAADPTTRSTGSHFGSMFNILASHHLVAPLLHNHDANRRGDAQLYCSPVMIDVCASFRLRVQARPNLIDALIRPPVSGLCAQPTEMTVTLAHCASSLRVLKLGLLRLGASAPISACIGDDL